MSREERRYNKEKKEKELYRAIKKDKSLSKYDEDAYVWIELPKPEFRGYEKFFAPADNLSPEEKKIIEKIIEKNTQGCFSKSKNFLKKNRKGETIKIEPVIRKVYVRDPLDIQPSEIPINHIPFFVYEGTEYIKYSKMTIHVFRLDRKYLTIKKAKVYFTHIKKLNEEKFQEIAEAEKEVNRLGGYVAFYGRGGYDPWNEENRLFKHIRKEIEEDLL